MSTVKLTVNGKAVSAEVEDRTLLVQLLRENLNLTGTHVGCDTSQCGACVVHIDGQAVKSCTVLAGQAAVLYYLSGYLFTVLGAFTVICLVMRRVEGEARGRRQAASSGRVGS